MPGDVFRCKVVITRGWPDLPASFSARFGDALHNYRCVLDHVAWQLVCNGVTPPSMLDDDAQRRIQFPFYSTEEKFDKGFMGRLPGVYAPAVWFIKALHAYVNGKATNDVLRTLIDLSNDDKHRTLPLIATAVLNVRGTVRFTNCEPISIRNPPTPPAVKDGAVITLIECRATRQSPNVQMVYEPTFHIALADQRGFGAVLDYIQMQVTQILNAPEIVESAG
jgi:hypothetical protein